MFATVLAAFGLSAAAGVPAAATGADPAGAPSLAGVAEMLRSVDMTLVSAHVGDHLIITDHRSQS